MRRWIFIAAIMGTLAAPVQGDTTIEPMDLDGFYFFIAVVRPQGRGLTFTRSAENQAWRLQIGSQPAAESPPGSTFNVPLEKPFRLFNGESELSFLPVTKDKEIHGRWIIEEQNRKGDIQVGILQVTTRRTPGMPDDAEVDISPAEANDLASLRDLEKDCSYGAGIAPRNKK